jgi:hypothetical protein
MRLLACLLTTFAAVASAQSQPGVAYSRETIVNRLKTDLAGLKDFHPDTGLPRVSQCLQLGNQVVEACEPFRRVVADLALIPSRPRRFPVEILSLNLINALAGRELEPVSLSLLSNSLVDAVAIADRAVSAHTPVSRSSAFRDSVTQMYTALVALGVDEARAETLVRNFMRNAEQLSRPPEIVPIPPGQPLR